MQWIPGIAVDRVEARSVQQSRSAGAAASLVVCASRGHAMCACTCRPCRRSDGLTLAGSTRRCRLHCTPELSATSSLFRYRYWYRTYCMHMANHYPGTPNASTLAKAPDDCEASRLRERRRREEQVAAGWEQVLLLLCVPASCCDAYEREG